MLVLTRQEGESIMIQDNIKIEVLSVRGTKVRLGITAPKDISVHRTEVWEAIKKEEEEEGGLLFT